jgi:hypothetical protein
MTIADSRHQPHPCTFGSPAGVRMKEIQRCCLCHEWRQAEAVDGWGVGLVSPRREETVVRTVLCAAGQGKREGPGTPHRSSAPSITDSHRWAQRATKDPAEEASWSSRIPGWTIARRTEDCADHLFLTFAELASWSSRIPGWTIASRTGDCADHLFTVSHHPADLLDHQPSALTWHHSACATKPGRIKPPSGGGAWPASHPPRR